MKFLSVTIVFLTIFFIGKLEGKECPPPLLSIGGGYFDAGKRHSGGLFQVEYRFGKYCFYTIRPQASLISPEFRSVFVGLGLGIEIYSSKHLIIIPSFSPGIYFKGSGRDLGHPLEFRSSIEVCYEWDNMARMGIQYYHLSNASLSNRNPGANAAAVYLAIPLSY